MTLARVDADDLSNRLEAKMREIQLRRDRAVDLQRRISTRYAQLAGDPAVKQALATIGRDGTDTVSLGPGRDMLEAPRRL